jgi:hypothetical protein
MPAIGDRITIANVVQGVRYWMAEININGGGYTELTENDPIKVPIGPYSDVANDIYWLCPRVTAGSGDTERLVYTFSFGYTLPVTLNVGDTFTIRLTPAGFSSGMGAAIVSETYTVTEMPAEVISVNNSFAFTEFAYIL